MGLKMWRNGEGAGIIQKIIEYNFKVLGKHLSQNMLSLSTTERELLSGDYLSKGLRVYDTTQEKWFVYNGVGWDEVKNECVLEFLSADWRYMGIAGYLYYMVIPYSTHQIKNPSVQLFIQNGVNQNGNVYEFIIGEVEIDDGHGVTIWSDMPFNGKVVIK